MQNFDDLSTEAKIGLSSLAVASSSEIVDPVGDGVSGTKYEDDVRVIDGTEDAVVSMDNGEFGVLVDGEVKDRMSK